MNIVEEDKVDSAGHKYTHVDGTMKADERSDLEARDFDNDRTIMLASLGVCAVGLNLVVANNMILLDSWWSQGTRQPIECIALDRSDQQRRPISSWTRPSKTPCWTFSSRSGL